MLQYALEVSGGADELAVTCLDRLNELPALQVCCRYQHPAMDCFDGPRLRKSAVPDLDYQQQVTDALQACEPAYTAVAPQDYLEWLEGHLGYPIGLTSLGPAWTHKVTRSRVSRQRLAT